jgi:uncharacterized protein YndB with AHSA1/START domain
MSETVTIDTWIKASPETVFNYLTDAEKMAAWMGVDHRIDPQPGGEFWVNMTGKHISAGEYKEVIAHSKIAFTFGWVEGEVVPPGTSTVTITMEPEGEGTRVRLVQEGLPTPDSATQHEKGWRHYFDRLTTAAAAGFPGPDPWLAAS